MRKEVKEKTAVILFNLGGPDNLKAVKPFLFNLFNDKAIISVPNPIRYFLAKLISSRREKIAQDIYKEIGGKSPILQQTKEQAKLLEKELNKKGEFKTFIVMRYWKPFTKLTVKEVKKYNPDKIILLPLYPQFSTTTSDSSIKEWHKIAKKEKLVSETKTICCYPNEGGFIDAHIDEIKKKISKIKNLKNYRFLFSAHGLPQKIIDKGDPYQWQVEETAHNIIKKLNIKELDYTICYQSKVGPLKWLEPSTEHEIEKAGKEKKSLIIVPLAFVSEHSETLVELDIEYKEVAEKAGVQDYVRVPTLSLNKKFIAMLATLCEKSLISDNSFYQNKICPNSFCKCPR
jgi:ferrochelatase